MRKYISSISRFSPSLSSFFLVFFFSRMCVCMRITHTYGAGLSTVNTPVVYTNSLSRHTGTRRGEPVEDRCGGAYSQRETYTTQTTAWRRTNSSYGFVTRQQAGAIRWGPSKFQKRTRAPFATRIKGSNRDSFGQYRYDRRTRSSVHV